VNASIARRLRGSRGARQQLETPVDLLVVSSANPEDYANRGNLITPPRDRIGS
jgi:Mg-chelatase subunit ChlI